MRTILRIFLSSLLLFAIPVISFSQVFQGVYDVDSTIDWGWDIQLKQDGSYFVAGAAGKNYFNVMNMTISSDGTTVLNKNNFFKDSSYTYVGNPGTIHPIQSGGYVMPVTLRTPPIGGGYGLRSRLGLAKLTATGDTVFMKFYMDTSLYYESSYDVTVMPDGGYVIAGIRAHNTDTNGLLTPNFPLLIVRVDVDGNLIWERTYQENLNRTEQPNTISTLSGGRILVGAMSTYNEILFGYPYSHNTPWFLVLDGDGNVLRDTLYGQRYDGGGWIRPDINGGYFHTGNIDTVIDPDIDFWGNFPTYLAHLDTDFRIQWITYFNYSEHYQDRLAANIKQASDGSYVIAGVIASNYTGWSIAWGAKVNSSGILVWNHDYICDSTHDSYFRDLSIRLDGSIIFCGAAWNDTIATWRNLQDVWLVSVDSNGCLQPGCTPDTTDPNLAVPLIPAAQKNDFTIYPNPTQGDLNISSAQDGNFYIIDMLGKRTGMYKILNGTKTISLPENIPSGIYTGIFKPDNATETTTVKIVYYPQ